MNIDRSHIKFLMGTLAIVTLATIAHMAMPAGSIAGHCLDSWFGIFATGLVFFAGSLPLRKRIKKTRLPIPNLQTYLKLHIWSGLLVYPVVLLHAGFRYGDWVTTTLHVVLTLILLTGLAGLLFQHLTALANKAPSSGRAATAARIIVVGRKANLFLHVPLTATLIVLIIVHVVASWIY